MQLQLLQDIFPFPPDDVTVFSCSFYVSFLGWELADTNSYIILVFLSFRIIQQLVNGIIAPTTIPNLGLGPW